MAALTFLRHWRPLTHSGNLTTLLDTSSSTSSFSDDDDDDGPFFEINFSTPNDEHDICNSGKTSGDANMKPQPFSAAFLLRSARRLRFLASRNRRQRSPPVPRKGGLLSFSFRAIDDEKKILSKEAVLNYLGKIRVGSSRRSWEKVTAARGEAGLDAGVDSIRRGSVCKHLGKSRSASGTVVAVRRRDHTLLEEEEDGIHGAIAHCKKSFQATRDGPENTLLRSRSDSCEDRHRVDQEICKEGFL